MRKVDSRPHADDALTFPAVLGCCGTRHRDAPAMARCYLGLGGGARVAGVGEYAVLHYYALPSPALIKARVRLYPTADAARDAARNILRWHGQSGKCSGTCTGERPGLLRFVLR